MPAATEPSSYRIICSHQSPGTLTNLADDEDYNYLANRVNASYPEVKFITSYIIASYGKELNIFSKRENFAAWRLLPERVHVPFCGLARKLPPLASLYRNTES